MPFAQTTTSLGRHASILTILPSSYLMALAREVRM